MNVQKNWKGGFFLTLIYPSATSVVLELLLFSLAQNLFVFFEAVQMNRRGVDWCSKSAPSAHVF